MNSTDHRDEAGDIIQHAISLVNFVVTKVDFFIPPGEEDFPDAEVVLSHKVLFDENIDRSFMVFIQLSLKSSKQTEFRLNVEAVALFNTNKSIDESFKLSPLANVNAVAIAFPFLRSFLASFTVNAGVPRMLLPSINFHKASKASVESSSKSSDRESQSSQQG